MGDIFFTAKIACSFIKNGHKVFHPITKELAFFKDYMINDVNYCIPGDDFPYQKEYDKSPLGSVTEFSDCIVVATDGSDFESDECGIMLSKYRLVDIDYRDWSDFFNFKRDEAKEQELLNVLGINKPWSEEYPHREEFILVNKNIGSKGCESSWEFPVPTDKKIIETGITEGFTPFDWCKVYELASEFHIMETSLCYILEKLDLRATIYKLYHRSYGMQVGDKGLLSLTQFKEMYTKHPWEHFAGAKQVSSAL